MHTPQQFLKIATVALAVGAAVGGGIAIVANGGALAAGTASLSDVAIWVVLGTVVGTLLALIALGKTENDGAAGPGPAIEAAGARADAVDDGDHGDGDGDGNASW